MRRGKTIQKERWPLSFEEKAILIISMISEGFLYLWAVLYEAVHIIEGRIEGQKADRRYVANLIEQLMTHFGQYESNLRSFVEKGKILLLSPPDWADDLSHLCDLMESCPQLFSSQEKIQAQESVRETAGNIVDWDLAGC